MLRLGIIGHPIHHTLSPRLHEHLMQALGLPGEYRVYDVAPDALPETMSRFQASGELRGLNVTIPHKVAVKPQLTRMTPEARLIGAVNTLAFTPDGITGHNTDGIGFLESLPTAIAARLPESRTLVLGAGGAARAVLVALLQLRTAEVTLAVRNPEKALALMADVLPAQEYFEAPTRINVRGLAELDTLEAYDGVINTTPIGMWPDMTGSPLPPAALATMPAGGWVYDLIYRPLETRLLTEARAHGLATINGIPMLAGQGAAAFEWWTGCPVPAALRASVQQMLRDSIE